MRPENNNHLKYIAYIKNTGGSPTIDQFDEDWEPIGTVIRTQLKANKLIYEKDGKVYDSQGGN